MMRRLILLLVAGMSTVGGFYVIMLAMGTGAALGAPNFTAVWLGAFTLALSVLSVIQTSAIMVSQRQGELRAIHREDAMQKKLDTLVAAIPEADNALIGSEALTDGEG